jgi:protein involved in polysaccharide export with SLBB domain
MKQGRILSLFLRIGVFFTLLTLGCGAKITVPPLLPEDIPQIEAAGNYPHLNYRLEPGDTIQIGYPFHPEFDQNDLTILPDGKIMAALVGETFVAGMKAAELEKILVERTSHRLRDPEVIVNVTKYAPKSVYVSGEVRRPGTFPYRKDLTPLQAISEAGGFLDTALVDSVILIRTGGEEKNFVSRKLDLATVVTNGDEELLTLAPHDVVFVPRTPIANANIWVKQHLTDLVPFTRVVPSFRAPY